MSPDSRAERRELLARVPLFEKLSAAELDELLQVARTRRLAAREELFHKGDEGTQVFLVMHGRLKAMTTSSEGDDVVFSIMGPGEVFGELALLGGGRRTATVVAIDACELLLLDRREFLPFLRRHPDAAIRLLEVLARRVEHASELLEDTKFRSLPSRLAKQILALARRYGERTPGGVRIELRLSQQELGDLAWTTRESVNKQLRAWSTEGVLDMERGWITIHRPETLERLAEEAPAAVPFPDA
jgi:CRP-like cAMP-binding protein